MSTHVFNGWVVSATNLSTMGPEQVWTGLQWWLADDTSWGCGQRDPRFDVQGVEAGVRAGEGRTCTVRSNASRIIVTQGTPVNRQTETRENITFPQLRWRPVINRVTFAKSPTTDTALFKIRLNPLYSDRYTMWTAHQNEAWLFQYCVNISHWTASISQWNSQNIGNRSIECDIIGQRHHSYPHGFAY